MEGWNHGGNLWCNRDNATNELDYETQFYVIRVAEPRIPKRQIKNCEKYISMGFNDVKVKRFVQWDV